MAVVAKMVLAKLEIRIWKENEWDKTKFTRNRKMKKKGIKEKH